VELVVVVADDVVVDVVVEVVLVLVVLVTVVASNLHSPVVLLAASRADEGHWTLYQPSGRTTTQGEVAPSLGWPGANAW